MKNSIKVCMLSLGALVLVGCGAREYKPAEGMAAAAIFSEACESCHGEGGAGKFGFLLKIAGTEGSLEEIAGHIRDGGLIMPSFPNIGEKERQALAEYVKSL